MSATEAINISKEDYENTSHKIKIISELEGKCVYFPLADYHNIKIFKDHNSHNGELDDVALKNSLSSRLYLALLLSDTVILHCSDPLRSQIVFEILNENIDFIKDGTILFIFSNHINNIKSDFQKYIKDKCEEYKRNEFSEADVKSLEQRHINETYYQEVINLLMHTPFILKKLNDGSSGFKTLIQNDLNSNVECAVMGENNFARSHIRLLNLTLYQLLNLKYVESLESYTIKDVFEHEKIEEFIANWEADVDKGAPFSRHTIVEQLRQEFVNQQGKVKRSQERVINAIETRLSMLYSKLNCPNHQIIEFHPATEKRSVYSWKYFLCFLNEISENRSVTLTSEKVKKIRSSDEWDSFRNDFLACMADLNSYISSCQQSELRYYEPDNEVFMRISKRHKVVNKYREIHDILINNSH